MNDVNSHGMLIPHSAFRTPPLPRRAFTLMELLIVLLIIAVLAALALTALQGAAEEARADRTRAIIQKLDQLIMQRYDGYRTQLFPMTAADGERSNRFLRRLLADSGVIWAGGDAEGLARFDIRSERWTFYRHDAARPDSISPGSVFNMARGPDGRIWLGLLGGLDCLDPASGRFEHHRAADGSGLPDSRVSGLLFDRHGDLWVGTWHGVVRRTASGRSGGGWRVRRRRR